MTKLLIISAIVSFIFSVIFFCINHSNTKADTRGRENIRKENEKNARSSLNWAITFLLITLVFAIIIFFRTR